MSKLLSIIILCVGVYIHANAQSYTERVQQKQQGKGTVTIHQSKEIDDLVNDPTATGVQTGNQKPHSGSQTPVANTQQPQASNQKPQTSSQTPAANNQQPQANNQQPQVSSLTPDANGQEPTTTATRKVTGYRVQAFAGGNSRKDRQTAEQISHNIKSQFPNISVYVHFYSPRWICRVGNFRTYEEAHQMMVRLQNMGYKQATVVKGKITVAY